MALMTATSDRRPIASREMRLFQRIAMALARAGVSPNLISILGLIAALLAAAALVATQFTSGVLQRLVFAGAAAGIQLRLLANMLDGMVAIAANKASPIGELFNEIPDRLSDTAILVAAGYGVSGIPALGWAAAVMALFVTYLRALGKSMGVPGLFHGPMSKSHRMFTMTIAGVYLACTPRFLWPSVQVYGSNRPAGIMALALAIIILGGVMTSLRRLTRICRALRNSS